MKVKRDIINFLATKDILLRAKWRAERKIKKMKIVPKLRPKIVLSKIKTNK